MRHHVKVLSLMLCMCALVGMCACSGTRTPIEHHPVAAGDILADAGRWILYLGLAAIGAGLVGKVLGKFPATALYFQPFGTIADELIVLGVAALGMGSCVVWIGIHSWIIYAASGLCVALYLVRHRALLASWLGLSAVAVKVPEPSNAA